MNEYATGLIRVLEKNVTDRNDLIRMIDSPEAKNAFSVLNDTDIKDNLLGLEVDDFEIAIKRDNEQLKKFIKKLANRALYRLVFLEEDFFNLKLAVKEKISGIHIEKEEYSSLGTINPVKIRNAIKNKTNLENYPAFKKTVAIIKNLIKKKNENKFIEAVIDAEYFQCALTLSREIKSAIATDFYKLTIDVSNIKNMFRAKKIGLPLKEIKKQLIKGGAISIEKLADTIKTEDQNLINFLKKQIEFSKEWENIWEEFSSNYNIVLLEKNLELFALNRLKEEVKKISGGPEIIFHYAIMKKTMNTNIRLIMTGKINNIPIEEIKMRLKNII
ncbi:MAG: V-type ATPase subunit [Patescibacteria group bacterium]